ncbi:acetoin utilization protein AcuC [Heliorestis acidaminivorans]|uniref:Acetoin utilization protein AcuC n=1 Tax=Heliorestis acidaminivorans TaxID=553427 RepID=A0A6I0F289_9FIRM|nr:acetoin utilization protein AcuC [Heliorestis acidaminivorans]KAB2954161.1 acetoin utilization protein AcuC [Heliorestis acidaminivorans]
MNKLPSLIYSPALHAYKFGPDHPFNPLRLELTVDLIEKYGILPAEQKFEPETCELEDILMVHQSNFVHLIEKASQGEASKDLLRPYGLGSDDTPAFPGMFEATKTVLGATLLGAKMIMEGKSDHVFSIGGGLHHGHRNKASGFCILNDAAVAISYLQRKYGLKVAYIDTDAHHGDGVQFIFYDDPTVLTISLHETGRYLFPGTGQVEERGRFEGYGFSVNLPLEAYTEDDSFIELYEQSIEPLLEAFQPDILITQNGCDAHYLDPLTHLAVTTRTFEVIPHIAHRLAHKYCQGRWLALGGGGYDHWRVVPRAWTLLWAEMNDITLPNEIPQEWLQRWQKQSPVSLPLYLRDGENEFPPIPRREIITDKNKVTLQRTMGDAVELIMSRRAC